MIRILPGAAVLTGAASLVATRVRVRLQVDAALRLSAPERSTATASQCRYTHYYRRGQYMIMPTPARHRAPPNTSGTSGR